VPHESIDLSQRIQSVLEGVGPPRIAPGPAAGTWRVRANEHLDAYKEARLSTSASISRAREHVCFARRFEVSVIMRRGRLPR